MNPLVNIEELSSYIQKSVTSIRSDASRNPQALPPICRIPGSRRLLWRLEDIEAWLAGHVDHASSAAVEPEVVRVAAEFTDLKRKPGRPTKKDQIAKRHSAGGAK